MTYIRGQHTFKFGAQLQPLPEAGEATGNEVRIRATSAFTNGERLPPHHRPAAAGRRALPVVRRGVRELPDRQRERRLHPGVRVHPTANINQNDIELYAQDDWRATRRLTVNLGVRYSYFGQPYDINNELSNFSPHTFDPLHAETISSNGNLCTMAGQTTLRATSTHSSGVVTTYTLEQLPQHQWSECLSAKHSGGSVERDNPGRSRPDRAEMQGVGSPNYPVRRAVRRTGDRTHGSPSARKWDMRRSMTGLPASGLPTTCSATARPRCGAATEWPIDDSPVSIVRVGGIQQSSIPATEYLCSGDAGQSGVRHDAPLRTSLRRRSVAHTGDLQDAICAAVLARSAAGRSHRR